jgi:hypothetical protein
LLAREDIGDSTYFHISDVSGKHSEMPWRKFVSVMQGLGYRRRIGIYSEVALNPKVAASLTENWVAHLRK